MTEIPEHLLKRSRAAKAKAAGESASDDAGDATAAAPSKAVAAAPVAAAPVVAEEKPPPPPNPMVEAHERRRKIPWWALSVLAAIPLWAYVYQGTLEPPPEGETIASIGDEAYAVNCAGCHGGGGGGGVGPAFTDGAIYETFPSFVDHYDWVRLGSTEWANARGATYGAQAKPVGGGMPGFAKGVLSDEELIFIILHERELGGEPEGADAIADFEYLVLAAEYLFEHPDDTLAQALEEIEWPGTIGPIAAATE